MSSDSRIKRLALATASIFLLIVGALLGVSQMYLMAVAISLIPLVFWFVGLFLQRGVFCERVMPATAERGERVKVELYLRNASMFPKFYVRAVDHLPRWVKFDGDADESSMILYLAAGETAKVVYFIRPFRRGQQAIGPTKITNPDLIGLSNYSRTINASGELLVLPEVIPINVQFLSGGASQGWRDQENATTRGIGTDFQGVREYQIGDDLRRVNWKTTARTGKLAVTEYALGYANDITLALDLDSRSYGDVDQNLNSAFETAIEIAASVTAAALRQGSSVQIITNGDLKSLESPLSGSDDTIAVLTQLALAAPKEYGSLAEVISRYELSNRHIRSLIVITGARPYDGALNVALESYRKTSGTLAMIFWIDIQSFNVRVPFTFLGASDYKKTSPTVYENIVGKNIVIGPESDLHDLFSRPIR